MRRLAFLCAFLWLAGCQSALDRLHSLDPQANDFASALAAEYMAYGDSEKEQGREIVAEHFAAKGLKALSGEAVEPDTPSRQMPGAVYAQLMEARTRLTNLMNEDIRRVAPQTAARAQLMFDCWLHQEIRRIAPDVAPCAEEFKTALKELAAVASSFIYHHEFTYSLRFDEDSAEPDQQARVLAAQISEALKDVAYFRIELHGYEGADPLSRALAGARLDAVRKLFIEQGISATAIVVAKEDDGKAVKLSSDLVQDDSQVDVIVRMTNMEPTP